MLWRGEVRIPIRRGRVDVPFIAINLLILAGAGLLLASFEAQYRKRVQAEALRDNKFLTTEWRLMKELKEKTDRELRDKDREIAELRLRYLNLKGSGSSTELLSAIKEEMRLAEIERQTILSSRIKAVAEPPTATPSSRSKAPPKADASETPDSPLNALMRRRIADLEAELESSRSSSVALERKIEELRRQAAKGSEQTAVAAASAQPAPVPETDPTPQGGAPAQAALDKDADMIGTILAALERERESLAEPQGTLGIAELKTRSLLRAIVRTPAIRAQYPDLVESLDRYLALVGKEEYLRGKREAYADLIGTIDSVAGRKVAP